MVVSIAPGAAAPAQTIVAFNSGDGSLALTASVPADAKWLTASVGTYTVCGVVSSVPCVPLVFTFNSTSLARGTYTAAVTISDPHAIDAPQVVIVTLQVGAQPTAIDQYLAPGKVSDMQLNTTASGLCFVGPGCPAGPSVSTQDGGSWLSIAVNAQGTFRIPGSYSVHLAPPPAMQPGTYTGVIDTGSAADGTIPVTMRVTDKPIAVPSATKLHVRLAQGGPALTYPFLPYISLTNSGLGNLSVQDVTASGSGVSAYNYSGLAIITLDPGSLAPGVYTDGAVTIQCNGANCPVKIPVRLEIVPKAPPAIQYQGVLDNATFSASRPIAPGDICVVKGEQFSQLSPASAAGAPLPTTLGGAQVSVNGVIAPLFYSSAGQLAFQVPSSTTVGVAKVQVLRDGQPGNTVTVNVAARAPGIVAVTDTAYNLVDSSHPAQAGSTLILWAIGLGPTSPSVADGAAAPAKPLANLTVTPSVDVGGRILTPTFAGLAPDSVGLYQLIVTLPADLGKGTTAVGIDNSNVVPVAVQ